MKLHVFVDMDGTLIDKDDHPRPYLLEFFEVLSKRDYRIIVWSAGGAKYAQDKIQMLERHFSMAVSPNQRVDIDQFIDAYMWKADWSKLVFEKPQFYVDDDSALLEAAKKKNSQNGTFRVPFYETSIFDGNFHEDQQDWWLKKALQEIIQWKVLLENMPVTK